MSEEAATVEYSDEAKKLGDEIAGMTLKQAKELSDYLENEHGIKAAAGGGGVMVAAAGGGGEEAAAAQTEFDVVLTGFGDKKLDVVKVVKTITRKKAHRITVQAHSYGTAVVTTTWKAMAKTMCLKLQKYGLTSSISPDGGGGGGGGGGGDGPSAQ